MMSRWLPDIFFGYGYPILNYYSLFFFYVGAGLSFFLGNPVLGLNLALVLVHLASGMGMFWLTSRMWGRASGIIAAIVYLYAPFHLYEIYYRGACAEFTAYLFLPLLILAVREVALTGSARWGAGVVLSLTGLILSHNIMAAVGTSIALIYGCFVIIFATRERQRSFLVLGASFVLAIGLTAFFWMPIVFEHSYVMLSRLVGGGFDYSQHFLSFQEILGGWGGWGA
ncbi:MAG: hypothetical protein GX606_06690, partial [Elusimicrobia bacterium]|nr:hypothetical protein [Elusimicrobiota bacterium]